MSNVNAARIVIGGFLLVSGAVGLVAAPAISFVSIFASIGTREAMMQQLQLFRTWMPFAVSFSAAAYVAGLGLLRSRPWARRTASVVLLGQFAAGAWLAVVSSQLLLWGPVIVTAVCLVWLLGLRIQGPRPQMANRTTAFGLAIASLGAVGLTLLYVVALLGLERIATSETPGTELGLVLLPTLVAALVVLSMNRRNQAWLPLLLGFQGAAMLSIALIAAAFLPSWVQSTWTQQPASPVLTMLLGVSAPSAGGLTAFALLLRLVVHLLVAGGAFVTAGAALGIARSSAERGLPQLASVSVVAFVLVFQLLQLPGVIASPSTFTLLVTSCSVLFAIVAAAALFPQSASPETIAAAGVASDTALVAIPLMLAFAGVLTVFVPMNVEPLPSTRSDPSEPAPSPAAPPSPTPSSTGVTGDPRDGISAPAASRPDPLIALNPVPIGGDLRAPRKTKHVPPVYPAPARAERVQGVVMLEVVLDAAGRVVDAKVLRSIPLLDKAALEAVSQWEFAPTVIAGKPTPVVMTVPVSFAP